MSAVPFYPKGFTPSRFHDEYNFLLQRVLVPCENFKFSIPTPIFGVDFLSFDYWAVGIERDRQSLDAIGKSLRAFFINSGSTYEGGLDGCR